MGKKIKKYVYIFIMALQSALEYRMNLFLSLVSGVFMMAVQCCLWNAVFTSSGKEIINGYTYHHMILYSVIVGMVSKLITTEFENEIANDIKNGAFSKFLTQPMRYALYRFFHFMGGKMVQTTVIMLFITVFLVIYSYYGDMEISLLRILAFLLSCILAMVINFLLFYSVSTLAFVVTEVWGIFIAFQQGVLLLGGGIFPLDFFGDTVYKILHVLPFEYVLFFPVNVINGYLNIYEIVSGLWMQLFWMALLAVVSKASWKWGTKRYIAAGG